MEMGSLLVGIWVGILLVKLCSLFIIKSVEYAAVQK